MIDGCTKDLRQVTSRYGDEGFGTGGGRRDDVLLMSIITIG